MMTTLLSTLALSTAAIAGDGQSSWPQNDARYAAETGQDRFDTTTQNKTLRRVQTTRNAVSTNNGASLAFIRAEERKKFRALYR